MIRRRHLRKEPKPSSEGDNKKILYILSAILITIIICSSIVNAFRKSYFFTKGDRLNVVFYDKNTQYYSLGIRGAGDYSISFYPDLKVWVPGGYGYYRIGALAKLVSWDKKPEIFQRTFSLATYSFTNVYFYPNTSDVFFGKDANTFSLPSLKMIFTYNSNASFLDRVYLALAFLNRKLTDFKQIPIQSTTKDGDSYFAENQFEEKYTGYFYQPSYRDEGKSVQILYNDDYANGERVGKILEGNGIRVGDISPSTANITHCTVVEDNDTVSISAQAILQFFHCDWKKGKTDLYDILFELGDREKDWN